MSNLNRPAPSSSPQNSNVAHLASVTDALRHLPHSPEAERALLGALLYDNHLYEAVTERVPSLSPEYFHNPRHGDIYAACAKFIEDGRLADPTTLGEYFQAEGQDFGAGAQAFLSAFVAEMAAPASNAADYAETIHNQHIRRELVRISDGITQRAVSGGSEGEVAVDQIDTAEQELFNLATEGRREGGVVTLDEAVIEACKVAEAAHKSDRGLTGVTTGLIDLDRMTGGLQATDLIILAGRPAMGKTALATNIAYNASKACRDTGGQSGAPVAFFSQEMANVQLALRLLSDQAEVSSDLLRRGQAEDSQIARIPGAMDAMRGIPMLLNDQSAMTVGAIRTQARRLKRTHGIGLIVIDYLQLLLPPFHSRNDGRVQEVSKITRALKHLAKDLQIPVLALSQLSREVEKREEKRPLLSDLRESGTIEQDADLVMFLYRHAYYLEQQEPVKRTDEAQEAFEDRHSRWLADMNHHGGKAELIVAKQRHGSVGTAHLSFTGEFTRFGNLALQG